MFEAFENYLREKAGLDAEEINAVREVIIEKKIRKRQYLLQDGDSVELDHHIPAQALNNHITGGTADYYIIFGKLPEVFLKNI